MQDGGRAFERKNFENERRATVSFCMAGMTVTHTNHLNENRTWPQRYVLIDMRDLCAQNLKDMTVSRQFARKALWITNQPLVLTSNRVFNGLAPCYILLSYYVRHTLTGIHSDRYSLLRKMSSMIHASFLGDSHAGIGSLTHRVPSKGNAAFQVTAEQGCDQSITHYDARLWYGTSLLSHDMHFKGEIEPGKLWGTQP